MPPCSPSPGTRGGRGLSWVLALLVFAASFGVFYERAARVGYNTDEGQAIWPSQYFQFVFLEGKLTGPVWEPNYWVLTQTPVYRYVIGAGIWLGGATLQDLDLEHRRDEVSGPGRARYLDPETYRDERKLAEQRRVPRPSPEALWAARVPMVLMGAGTAAMLYLVAAELSGVIGGLVAAGAWVAAPFVLTLVPRAHTEAPFLFFLMLGLWFSVKAAQSGRRIVPYGVLAGVSVGLSAGSKLTSVLTYHVVAGRLDAGELMKRIHSSGGSAKLKTVNGETLSVMMNGPRNIVLKDSKGAIANISTYDVMQSNGVIHVIDRVLMP